MKIRKIFDVDLRDISIDNTVSKLDGSKEASILYQSDMFFLQLPSLRFVDVDTETKQLVLALRSTDSLYDDIMNDFVTELNSIIAESSRALLINNSVYKFSDIYSIYDKHKVMLINYKDCALFHKGKRIDSSEFETLLDNSSISIINHYESLSVSSTGDIVTSVKTYQINIT